MQAILHSITSMTIRMFHIAHRGQSEDTDNPPLLDVGNPDVVPRVTSVKCCKSSFALLIRPFSMKLK